LLKTSGQFVYAPDLGPPPAERCWFGPLYYHTFSRSLKFTDFVGLDIELEIDNLGQAARTGGVWVMLYDDTRTPIVALRVKDPFIGCTRIYPKITCFFPHSAETPPGPQYARDSYHETLRFSQNSSGLYGHVPRFGMYKILDSTLVPECTVKYLLIYVAGSKEANTSPWTFTDIVRVHDIVLTYRHPTPREAVWHNLCTTTDAFDGRADDSWLWSGIPPPKTSDGTIQAVDGHLHSPDLGFPPVERCWFGPLWYHTLSNPFDFRDFIGMDVEFEIDPKGQAGRTGGAWVILYDEDRAPVVHLRVKDPFMGSSQVYPAAVCLIPGSAYAPQGVSYVDSPYHETMRLAQNSTGLYGHIPKLGSYKLLDSEGIVDCKIKYVAVWIAGSKEANREPWPYTEVVRVHDIFLTYRTDMIDLDSCSTVGKSRQLSSFEVAFRSLKSGEFLLTSTNPGEFFFNIEVNNRSLLTSHQLVIEADIPADFVLMGTKPIRVYADGDEVTDSCTIYETSVTLYGLPSWTKLSIEFHLGYGLKGTTFPTLDDFQVRGYRFEVLSRVSDANLQAAFFSSSTLIGYQKKGTLIAGFVMDSIERPAGGVNVDLVDSLGNLVETASTSDDGFYCFFEPDPGDYTVELDYDSTIYVEDATVAQNEITEVDFTLL
jgi:hypothetical protein